MSFGLNRVEQIGRLGNDVRTKPFSQLCAAKQIFLALSRFVSAASGRLEGVPYVQLHLDFT